MAKFFKNYKTINLKILNDEISNTNDEELIIDPKYLGMTHLRHCDFCNNEEKASLSSTAQPCVKEPPIKRIFSSFCCIQ